MNRQLDIEPFLESWVKPWFEKGQVSNKIQIDIQDGQEGLKNLSKQGQKFDLVFIDADKPGYAAYYDLLFSQNLLQPHATIVADNTAFRGVPWVPSERFGQENGTAMAEFNKKIRYNTLLFCNRDCGLRSAFSVRTSGCMSPYFLLEMACLSSSLSEKFSPKKDV